MLLRTAWRSYTTSLAAAFVYRSQMLFWMLWRVTIFLTATSVWAAIYAEPGHTVIGGYTLDGMLTYYLLAQIVFTVTMSFFEFQMVEEIRAGNLSLSLTKPWGYASSAIIGTIAWNGLQFLLGIALFSLLAWLTGLHFGAELVLIQIPFFVVSLLLGLLFGSLSSILMGSLTFWMEEPSPLFGLKMMSFQFLSGVLLPLSVFPAWAQPILQHSPFPVVAATPVRFLTTAMDVPTALLVLLEQAGWTAVIALVTWRVWRAGLRRFESAGG